MEQANFTTFRRDEQSEDWDEDDSTFEDETSNAQEAFRDNVINFPKQRRDKVWERWNSEIPKGRRDVELASLAGDLRADGLSPAAINIVLQDHNREWCKPPLEPEQVRKIANSIGAKPTPKLHQRLSRAGNGIWLMERSEWLNIPKPQYLIPNLLTDSALTVLYGPAGGYKTFLAISIGYAIATGKPFAGRVPTDTGSVVYLAGEGIEYMPERLRALETAYGEDAKHFLIAKRPSDIQLLQRGNLKRIINSIQALSPMVKFVVIDTFSKSSGGVNEDRASEVRTYLNAAQRIRDQTKAGVMILHHTNKSGDFRGSVAFQTNVDAMMESVPSGTPGGPPRVEINCKKNRGYEPFPPVYLKSHVIPVPLEDNADNTTLVFLADQSPNPGLTTKTYSLKGKSAEAFKVLASFGENGATGTEWQNVADAAGISKRTYFDVRSKLIGLYVEALPDDDKSGVYKVRGTLTDGGVFVPFATPDGTD